MGIVDLSLSGAQLDWANELVQSGEFESLEAYVRSLVQHDMDTRWEHLVRLQREIDKGRASGIDRRSHEQIFADIRAKYFTQRDG